MPCRLYLHDCASNLEFCCLLYLLIVASASSGRRYLFKSLSPSTAKGRRSALPVLGRIRHDLPLELTLRKEGTRAGQIDRETARLLWQLFLAKPHYRLFRRGREARPRKTAHRRYDRSARSCLPVWRNRAVHKDVPPPGKWGRRAVLRQDRSTPRADRERDAGQRTGDETQRWSVRRLPNLRTDRSGLRDLGDKRGPGTRRRLLPVPKLPSRHRRR